MGLRILEYQLLLRKGFYLKSNLYSKAREGLNYTVCDKKEQVKGKETILTKKKKKKLFLFSKHGTVLLVEQKFERDPAATLESV